ncbi:MAG: PDZ domain-containing protein, partial [Candidatus Wallbacteria bacterium]|nr:PDZ domain-containing protein [Candidatus Wallbacteria bacterium]
VFNAPPEVPVPDSIETRKVPRGEVDKHLQDLAGLLGTMRIQPYYDGGQPSGFLVTNIRPGSFIDQVGMTNGDILRFVNGQKIDNVQSAFQLYNIFKNSTNVEVTVIRDQRPVTLKYVIE